MWKLWLQEKQFKVRFVILKEAKSLEIWCIVLPIFQILDHVVSVLKVGSLITKRNATLINQ